MWNFLSETLDQWKVLDKTRVLMSDSAANMLKMLEFAPPDMDMDSVFEPHPQHNCSG